MNTSPQFHFPQELLTRNSSESKDYEYINTATLSSGIYTLRAGEADLQKPHKEDEIYYVLSGRSSMHAGEQTFTVKQGDVIFVPAFLDHRFFDIVEDLQLLVFFSKKSTP